MDPQVSRLRIFFIILVAVLALGTIGFATVEGLSWTDAMYFSIVSLAMRTNPFDAEATPVVT